MKATFKCPHCGQPLEVSEKKKPAHAVKKTKAHIVASKKKPVKKVK